ncbi:unnamed protein product [Prunus armeniaca]
MAAPNFRRLNGPTSITQSLLKVWPPKKKNKKIKKMEAHILFSFQASAQSFGTQAFAAQTHHLVTKRQDPGYKHYGPQIFLLKLQKPNVNATSSLTTWETRDCPTAPTEPGMLGHDHAKAYKFPTQKSLLDRELGGLLFTP